MSLETEIVLDRRQLRRRLSLWRGLAITGLVMALGGYLLSADETSGVFAKKHVARISFDRHHHGKIAPNSKCCARSATPKTSLA